MHCEHTVPELPKKRGHEIQVLQEEEIFPVSRVTFVFS